MADFQNLVDDQASLIADTQEELEELSTQAQVVTAQTDTAVSSALDEYRAAAEQEQNIRNIPGIALSIMKYFDPKFDRNYLRSQKERAIFEADVNNKKGQFLLQQLNQQQGDKIAALQVGATRLSTEAAGLQNKIVEEKFEREQLLAKISDTRTEDLTKIIASGGPGAGEAQKELTARQDANLRLQIARSGLVMNNRQMTEIQIGDILNATTTSGLKKLDEEASKKGFVDINGLKINGVQIKTALQERKKLDTEATLEESRLKLVQAMEQQTKDVITNANKLAASAGQTKVAEQLASLQAVLNETSAKENRETRKIVSEEVMKQAEGTVNALGIHYGVPKELLPDFMNQTASGRNTYVGPVAKQISDNNAAAIINDPTFASIFRPPSIESQISPFADAVPRDPVEYLDQKAKDLNTLVTVNENLRNEISQYGFAAYASSEAKLQELGVTNLFLQHKDAKLEPHKAFSAVMKELVAKGAIQQEEGNAFALAGAEFLAKQAGAIAQQVADSKPAYTKAYLGVLSGAGDPYRNVAQALMFDSVKTMQENMTGKLKFEDTGRALKMISPFLQ